MTRRQRVVRQVALGTLLIGLCGAGARDANAAMTLYVSPTGNDSNSGSITAPVATPARAVALAAPGDTIYFRAGSYTITHHVSVDKANLTLASYPGESAAIVGATTDEVNLTSIFWIKSDGVTLLNLEIAGGSYYGVKVESSKSPQPITGVKLLGCRIHDTGRDGIKTFNADTLLIESCEISHSGKRDPSNAEGIDSIGSLGMTIRKCSIHDIATNGLYLKGGAVGGVVEQNRVERTGFSGILLGQDTDKKFMRNRTSYEASDCVARNNVVVSTGGAGLGTLSGRNNQFLNNTLYDVAQIYNGGFYIATNSRNVQSRQVTFKNNVVEVVGDRPLAFVLQLADPLVSDSNAWFKPNGGVFLFRRESGNQVNIWTSLAEWQAGMNADQRSIAVDPMLNPLDLYKPFAGSPVIDAGETLFQVTTDYSDLPRPQGAAYDIGAHESASP